MDLDWQLDVEVEVLLLLERVHLVLNPSIFEVLGDAHRQVFWEANVGVEPLHCLEELAQLSLLIETSVDVLDFDKHHAEGFHDVRCQGHSEQEHEGTHEPLDIGPWMVVSQPHSGE